MKLLSQHAVRHLLRIPFASITDAIRSGSVQGVVRLSNGRVMFTESGVMELQCLKAAGHLSPQPYRRAQSVRRLRYTSEPCEQGAALVAAAANKE